MCLKVSWCLKASIGTHAKAICLTCACTGCWCKFRLSNTWALPSFCGLWACTAPAGSTELSLDHGSHGNFRETSMGAVPKPYVRAIELRRQQAGARCPGWVAGVRPCLSQAQQVHRVGPDPWWGERLGNVLGGQLPQLGCWAASRVITVTCVCVIACPFYILIPAIGIINTKLYH